MSDIPDEIMKAALAVEAEVTSFPSLYLGARASVIANALMAADDAARKRADAILLAFNDACSFCIECGDVEFLKLWVEGDFGSVEEQWPQFDMASTRASGADGRR